MSEYVLCCMKCCAEGRKVSLGREGRSGCRHLSEGQWVGREWKGVTRPHGSQLGRGAQRDPNWRFLTAAFGSARTKPNGLYFEYNSRGVVVFKAKSIPPRPFRALQQCAARGPSHRSLPPFELPVVSCPHPLQPRKPFILYDSYALLPAPLPPSPRTTSKSQPLRPFIPRLL